MDELTIEKLAALDFKNRIFDRFEGEEPEKWPFPNKKVMGAFIENLVRLKCKDNWEAESEKIYDVFDNYLNIVNYRRGFYDGIEKMFADYPSILFWQISLELDHHESSREGKLGFSEPELELYKYITDVAEDIIKNKSLLLEDIGNFINEKMRDLEIGDHPFNYEDHKKADDILRFFEPCMFLWLDENGNPTNRFYPYDLYEKIKELIPETFKWQFEYKSLYSNKSADSSEDSKESDTKGEEIESELSNDKLSQKISENEILEKLRYNFSDDDFLKDVGEVLFRRDDLVEPILQVPLKKYFVLGDGTRVEDSSQKIQLLLLIGTKKSFSKIWEILGARTHSFYEYANIIDKWAEHFPVKLLKKEVENQNIACIRGVLNTTNEYAVRALFAYLYKMSDVNIDPIEHVDNIGSDYTNYYRTLVRLSAVKPHDEDISIHRYCAHDVKCWHTPFHKILLLDIIGIINSDSVFGQKIRKTLEESNIYLTHKITFEQFIEIERLRKLSNEFDRTRPPRKFTDESSDDSDDSDDLVLNPPNEYDIKMREIWGTARHIPFALYEEYANSQERIKVRFWVYEHKELDLSDLYFSTYGYNDLRNIMLEKPFFYHEFSTKNINIMANYFYRELPYLDFVQSDEERSTTYIVSWKRYWRKFTEKAYEDFKQPEFEKPLLPIIPEYAEYLLSRTNDMFSTAIENIPYVEYKTFLTESRKLQIKICLKNGAICQEEADKLTTLAERCDSNYYAWSDKEIKGCLSPDTDSDKLNRINAILEPEFMVRVFEKSILWVMEHRDSELWLNARWFGMQIFNKSYNDRPAIWAKHLLKIADEWNGSENMLKKVCTALGHLRDPLGSKVPIKLREMVENPKYRNIKEDINIQLSLFNHENFRKMYHKGNEIKRVELCKRELIIGQNKEVREKTEKK